MRKARWQEAGEALEEALALCRAIGNPYAEAKMLYIYGFMHLQQGEPALAHKRLEEALAILNRQGERLHAQKAEQALRLAAEH